MELNEFLNEINQKCKSCDECDPCCTVNLLRKCIENERFADNRVDVFSASMLDTAMTPESL